MQNVIAKQTDVIAMNNGIIIMQGMDVVMSKRMMKIKCSISSML